MRFWDDMQNKYGFSDGEAVPDGAEVYRAVYIRAVNALAEQLGSTVRAVAYDRPGVHNWCLILFHQVSDLEAHGINLLTRARRDGCRSRGTRRSDGEAIRAGGLD